MDSIQNKAAHNRVISLPRKEGASVRKAKAFKATENSTGKHQSAMEAIARASGNGTN